MTETVIRRIEGEEMLEIMHWLPSYAFRSSPPLADKEERQERLRQRVGNLFFAVFEDGAPVACVESTPLTQNLRGRLFSAGGILDVATHPAARRKGYAREALKRLYATLHEDGRVFSDLWPFRESFYERLGYVTLPMPRKAIFKPSALTPLLTRDLGGSVQMMLIGDGLDIYLDYVRKLQATIHGMALFEHADRFNAQRNNYWLALAQVDDEIVGAMLYDLRGEQITQFTMGVRRFYYSTSQGKYLLLAWIARHVDQANRVEMWLPPYEYAETWLEDMQIAVEAAPIAPMGRVLDVAKMGGMSTGPGRFAAHISDITCPWNAGIWQFETADGKLHVNRAERADCELTIQALAALAYGTHDPGEFAMRGWGNPSPQVQQAMRSMFPRLVPHVHEQF